MNGNIKRSLKALLRTIKLETLRQEPPKVILQHSVPIQDEKLGASPCPRKEEIDIWL